MNDDTAAFLIGLGIGAMLVALFMSVWHESQIDSIERRWCASTHNGTIAANYCVDTDNTAHPLPEWLTGGDE